MSLSPLNMPPTRHQMYDFIIPLPSEQSKDVSSNSCSLNNNRAFKSPIKPDYLALSVPILRVEQLREECGSPSSPVGSESDFSEFSDGDIINRLGIFIAPHDDLAQSINQQMESYFSDDNILKDSFLLKHARRNKEGYVNLKLISSFKKMKAFTKDYRQVAYSIRKYSTKLEVNAEGNKVRRLQPLPDHDETKPSRTIFAVNLPVHNSSLESITQLFKPCGEIVMLQVLKPGKPLPSEYKKHLSLHTNPQSVTCAVIEFETYEQATQALELSTHTDDGSDWTDDLKVVLLSKSNSKYGDDSDTDCDFTTNKRPNNAKKSRSRKWDSYDSGSEGDILMPCPQQRKSSFDRGLRPLALSPGYERQAWPCSANGLSVPINNQRRQSMPLPTSPLVDGLRKVHISQARRSSIQTTISPPKVSPEAKRRASSGAIEPLVERPWIYHQPSNISRLPRGPESRAAFKHRANNSLFIQHT